jgi:hypothetical protein
MLGEKIGEESGKVTLRRTLANPGGAPKVETSFEASGSILGVNHMTIGTYTSIMRPDGTLLGEGQGVARGKDGAMASWVGQGRRLLQTGWRHQLSWGAFLFVAISSVGSPEYCGCDFRI